MLRVGVMGTAVSSVAVDELVMLSSEDVCGSDGVLYGSPRFMSSEPAAEAEPLVGGAIVIAFRGELTDFSPNAKPLVAPIRLLWAALLLGGAPPLYRAVRELLAGGCTYSLSA